MVNISLLLDCMDEKISKQKRGLKTHCTYKKGAVAKPLCLCVKKPVFILEMRSETGRFATASFFWYQRTGLKSTGTSLCGYLIFDWGDMKSEWYFDDFLVFFQESTLPFWRMDNTMRTGTRSTRCPLNYRNFAVISARRKSSPSIIPNTRCQNIRGTSCAATKTHWKRKTVQGPSPCHGKAGKARVISKIEWHEVA